MKNHRKKHNDTIGKTLTVVVALCLVCSALVSGAAVGLKPRQQEQKLLDKQRAILDVAGLLQPEITTQEIQQRFIARVTPRLLELNSGDFSVRDPAQFDHAQALRDVTMSIALDKEQDKAKIKRRTNLVPLWLVNDEQGALETIVLPVYGLGLWSMMYAFVALDSDGKTVKGISYYSQGETPGLGGEVNNPAWRHRWVGKKLFDNQGKPAIRIVKGGAHPDDPFAVDGLAGATLTSNCVQNTFDFWLGDSGFGPFLKKVQAGALQHGTQ